MNLKTHIIIKLKTLLLLAIAIAIIISIPLQFIDFFITEKNRLNKILTNKYYKIQFEILDLKTDLQQNKNQWKNQKQ